MIELAHAICGYRTGLVHAVQAAIDDPQAYIRDRPWMARLEGDDFGWEALLDQLREPSDGRPLRLYGFDHNAMPYDIRWGVQLLILYNGGDGLDWDWLDDYVANLENKGWDSDDIAHKLLIECGRRSSEIGFTLIGITRGDSEEVFSVRPGGDVDRIMELAARIGHGHDVWVLR
ncbi:DUF6630 family protein [Nocardia sp. NPDC004722]